VYDNYDEEGIGWKAPLRDEQAYVLL